MTVATKTALDPKLAAIREKVLAGERLTQDDGVALYRTRDVFTLGELANLVRERLHGRAAYYNINRHINYSNYCVLRCKFCAFYRPFPKRAPRSNVAADAPIRDADGGYEYSLDEIVTMAVEARDAGATEVHIVGGLHPKLPFDWYLDLCRGIRAAAPNLHIKAFTAIEIVHFTRISKPRRSIAEVLAALRDAGLDSMPGGGAEIFDDRVHDEAYKAKVGEKHWFDVHRAAHDLGIPTNATMLYGHIETPEERIGHMLKLREHQDESIRRMNGLAGESRNIAGADGADLRAVENQQARRAAPRRAKFNCFIPLSFIPDGSELSHLPGPTGLDDLRTLAISRLMLDNFEHVKAFWIMQSPKLAQLALNWGVDDFDGTVVWYDITKREGRGTNRQELSVDQIRALMREAGCTPIERDSLYRPVRRDPAGRVISDVTTPR
ncbi:MAG: radical SAM protein [Planctomycetota bacterium]|nr:MAG: radical SAM protein [Planctomycetota bacterium]